MTGVQTCALPILDACKGLKPQELAVRKLDKPAEEGDLKPAVPTPYSKAKVDKP